MIMDVARTLNTLADVTLDMGLLEEAAAYADEASRVAQESGNRHIETMTVTTRASILREMGRYEESLKLSKRAHEALQTMGMPGAQCENFLQIGLTHSARGLLDQAIEAYREGHAMAVRLGEHHLRARALLGIATCLRESDPHSAADLLREALLILEPGGLPEAETARQQLRALLREASESDADADNALDHG
jgi:tetratricopeptide (TPR) repeat protein